MFTGQGTWRCNLLYWGLWQWT